MKKLEIKTRRQSLGLTQSDLAIALGYEGAHANLIVAKWESGARPIPDDKADELQMLCQGMQKVTEYIPIEDVTALRIFCASLTNKKERRLSSKTPGLQIRMRVSE